MKLIKTSIFSGIITFVRICSGFLIGKVVALFIGPTGIALIGQFSNFISVVLTFSNGAINNGVIKYTAEYNDDEVNSKLLYSTAVKISIFCSIIVGTILIFFSNYISTYIFKSIDYSLLVKVFGITIIFYSLNSLLISILNGKGDIKKYTIVNTTSVLIGLILTITLVYFFRIQGALYSLILNQSIVFFFTLYLISKSTWFRIRNFIAPFSIVIAKKLSGFSLMAIASALTIPISQILLRNVIIKELGVDSAGYWQGMMRISDGYLMIIITSLSTYYLPKLSSLKTNQEIRIEVIQALKLITPIVMLGSILIYFSRFLIIDLLFTRDFREMESLFLFQLLGDNLKIASWLIGYIMVAKAMTRNFILLEIIINVTYVCIGYVCIHFYNLEGISFAFFLNYLICLIFLIIFFRKLLFLKYE